jgi:hypothetical protein
MSSRIILDEVNRLGINIHIPSNYVREEIANIIRAKYRTENTHQEQSTSSRIPIVETKNTQKKLQRKHKASQGITHRKNLENKKSIPDHRPIQDTQKKEIKLESKKAAERIDRKAICSNCKTLMRPLWRYSKSNVGEVYLCSLCKPEVFEKSFGSVDALNVAYQGGQFESDRRKY